MNTTRSVLLQPATSWVVSGFRKVVYIQIVIAVFFPLCRQSGIQPQLLYFSRFVRVLILGTVLNGTAFSQPLIEEQQRLNFGTLAISGNASVSRLVLPRSGSNVSIEGQFVLVARGAPGRYLLSDFPPFTELSISVSAGVLTSGNVGGGEDLSVDDFDSAELTTDAQGEAELFLGARLNTTGTGGGYLDAQYSGSTILRVDYWQPEVSAFVFNSKSIDIETELRSSLNIAEEQQLHFGTLFARTSTTSQATITVSPSGSYSISEPDNSRMVSLARPDQGVLRVTGAAPNYTLTITPQATDVLLEHTENPASAPHFVLSNLVTSPVSPGISDENGEMLIEIGGSLKTEQTASPEIYPSGEYEGTYQITVSY